MVSRLDMSRTSAEVGKQREVSWEVAEWEHAVQMYHSNPPSQRNVTSNAILHITDIYGLPLLQNKL